MDFIMKKTTFIISLFTLILQACSTHLQREPAKNLNFRCIQNQKKIYKLNRYKMRGTFIYFLNNNLKIYAYFLWQKINHNSYHLLLINPLDGNKLEISMCPNLLKLVDNDNHQRIIYSNNSEEEIRKFTGVFIPINSLCQWIIGLPGKAEDYKFDDQCNLKEIHFIQKCETWKVIYRSYNGEIKPSLPSNIEIKTDKKYIKLKINSWILE